MAATPYDPENAENLLGVIPEPQLEISQNHTLIAAAWEITKYLRASSKRVRPSTSKIAMTIAVSDIWALRNADSPWTPDACALAVISATTSQSTPDDADADADADAIIAEARARITRSLKHETPWRTFWTQAGLIGEAAGFRLEVEAAQARLLWERLLILAADANEISLAKSPETRNQLLQIRDNIAATEKNQLTKVHTVYATMTPEVSGSSILAKVASQPPGDFLLQESEPESARWSDLSPSVQDSDAHRIRVWFGTNREPVSPMNRNSAFSNRLSDTLRFGVCTVNVSKVKDATGGRLPYISAWLRTGSSKSGSKVDAYYTFNNQMEFLTGLKSEAAANPDERRGLLYVHGFNTNFEQAAISAADFSIAIKHRGPTAMFSWASAGKLFKYKQDSDTIHKSQHHIIEFLKAFTSQAGLDSVDLVAHSMGNRLVLRALEDWIRNKPPANTPIRNIYFGAPDVGRNEFLSKSRDLKKAAKKATLYISNSDTALAFSRITNRNHRAGLTPPLTVVPMVDTVETSNIDISRLRHAYITEAVALRADVFSIQEGKLDPNMRPNLDAVKISPGSASATPQEYWRFVN